jgi:hypothetical protein
MEFSDAKDRLLAAHTLLLEPAGSFEKFHALKKLISGITPELDEALEIAEKELHPLEQLLGHQFVMLGLENLPEGTESQKKRKKAVLYFWHIWDELRNEIERVHTELDASDGTQNVGRKSWHWGSIIRYAAGPVGLVTAAAVLFSLSAYTSVSVTIKNNNCPTMYPSASSIANYIPGVFFPTNPIVAGGVATAHIPTVPAVVEDLGNGTLKVNSLILHMTFQLSNLKSVQFDNMELLGRITDLQLNKQKMHYLEFVCK